MYYYENYHVNEPSGSDITNLTEYEENYDSHPCKWKKYSQNGNSYLIGRMDITTDKGVLHVSLDYLLRYSGGVPGVQTSDTIPYTVTIYGELDGRYVIFSFPYCNEAPTVEWLTSFGITPYVENKDTAKS